MRKKRYAVGPPRVAMVRIALGLTALALIAGMIVADRSEARGLGLGKAEARWAAEGEALDLAIYYTWASDWEINSCSRASRTKWRCSGDISGTEFDYCSSSSYRCYYTRHRCSFSVVVKRAGSGTVERSQNVRCTHTRISD
jgi:hypothetical protein